VFTATRRFMFFLDPYRTGAVSIKNLVTSPVMSELLALGMVGSGNAADAAPDQQVSVRERERERSLVCFLSPNPNH
jgi:hypothetical protein